MGRQGRLRHIARLVTAAVLIGVLFTTEQSAEPAEMNQTVKSGLAALQASDYEVAWAHFEKALQEESNQETKALLYFYMALTRHRQAAKMQKPLSDEALRWLETSADYYSRALELNPTSSGASSNLAQVHALLGDTEQAAKWFRAAIDLGGRNQNTYLANYADFLYETGLPDEAARYYRLALEREAGSKRAQTGLDRYYSELRRDNYGAHLWRQIKNGSISHALDASLAAVQQEGWTRDQYVEFITIAARCLSLQNLADASQLPAALDRIVDHHVVGPAVREIQKLYTGRELDPAGFTWWRSQVARVEDRVEPPRGGWPQEAFTALINSRGDYFQRKDDSERSEQHYQLAYGLTEHHLDPRALIKLADMWVKNDRQDKLEGFLRQQEGRLYDQKSGAIKAMHHKRTYELHRSLATVYVHLDRWQDPTGYRNAAFQLNAAMQDARQHNQQAAKQENPDLIIDTQLVTQLCDWYARNDKKAEGFTLRVKQAQYLNEIGAAHAARDVFEPVKETEPPAGVINDIEREHVKLKIEFQRNDGRLPDIIERGTMHELDQGGPGGKRRKPVPQGTPNWRTYSRGKIKLWYPAELSLSDRQLREWSITLERLAIRKDAPWGERSAKPQTHSQGAMQQTQKFRLPSKTQLRLLPDWAPQSFIHVECKEGKGRAVTMYDGQKVQILFRTDIAPPPSAFQYVR